jgi:starch synthase
MACGVAVVASTVGGIPEVVANGVTGTLVTYEPLSASDSDPADPQRFARDLADAINELVTDPRRATAMGEAGRQRVVERFSWAESARRVVELYRKVGAEQLSSGRLG